MTSENCVEAMTKTSLLRGLFLLVDFFHWAIRSIILTTWMMLIVRSFCRALNILGSQKVVEPNETLMSGSTHHLKQSWLNAEHLKGWIQYKISHVVQGKMNQPMEEIIQMQRGKECPRWLSGKESTRQCKRHRRLGFDLWVGNIPWWRKWQPTLVFLSGESHGQRSLVGYGPWGSQTAGHDWATERLCTHKGGKTRQEYRKPSSMI